ncbi:MAG: phospholipid/cholesterol/gamma-HCH transport system substrate-binding protein, partial [Solirubrobacterales bacterium]|nr:phospholipid/cholesterol/gamma-HCH transport system substrate-binding protein [Solirubrobacterales bacterium]
MSQVGEEEREPREDEEEEGSRTARIVGVAVLLVTAALTYLVLFGHGDRYQVTAQFANAGQLVKGNEVVVAGAKVGSVSAVELGPDGQALVTFSVDSDFAPLRRGTVATVRSPSLSQIAGRQVQLTLPPSSTAGAAIEDGGTLSQSETVSAVDLDQL